MKRPASLVVAILLILMACAQICRFIFKSEIVAAGIIIPLWASVIAAVVWAALAVWLLLERNRG